MKKLIIILFFSLFITGCDVTYKINLDYDKINEEILIIEENNKYEDDINSYLDEIIGELSDPASDTSGYVITKLFEGNKSGIKMMTSYEDIRKMGSFSRPLISCFTNYDIISSNKLIKINTGSGFGCFDDFDGLNQINIEIETKYKVKAHNATKVSGNTYVWELTKSNNIPIEIEISDQINNPSIWDLIMSNFTLQIIAVMFVFAGIPSIIVGMVYLNYRKINKI